MKTTVYLRVAKNPRARKGGGRAVATMTPQLAPLEDARGAYLPTTAFAIELDIPDAAFTSAAHVVAKLKVPEDRLEIAAEVLYPTAKEKN